MSTDGPWYRDGLRFGCTRCGNCCTGASGTVRVSDAEIDALARRTGLADEEFRAVYTRRLRGGELSLRERSDGSCVMYDARARGCSVYEERPRQCRTWPFWAAVVHSRERWDEEARGCPGIGRGERHDAERIAALAADDGTSGGPRRRARTLPVALAAFAFALGAAGAPCGTRAEALRADVVRVQARGAPGAYELVVTLKSPDRDCRQYANWWEVVSEDGKLLFRRVLMHSHPDEQPFARPGGPVPIAADTTVIVRAHLVPSGYTGTAMRGSVARGFTPWTDAPAAFAPTLATQPPLPNACWR